MECNKEEALRARSIAGKKLESKDFIGAQKIALKAQQLFPDLENISQLLAVCEVHCSAETKVNGSEDWYGILQVEPTAEEFLIKKQYRKLALLLHPDKNKFAGAEAAFKLVGEAHRTLSDQPARSAYDMKRRATIPTVGHRPPPHQSNMTSNTRKQPAAGNSYQNSATTPLTQQETQTAHATQTFWTICPSCGTRYQYYRTILKKALRCQNCMNPFIAYDLNAQGACPGLNSEHSWNQPGNRQCKDFQGHCSKNTCQQGNSRVNPCMDTQGKPSTRVFRTTNVFDNNAKENSQAENGVRKEQEVEVEEVKFEKVNKREPVMQSSRNPRSKRRKMVVESSDSESIDSEEISVEESDHSESSDTGTTDSEEIIIEESEHATAQDTEMAGHSPRRSTRQKHNVSYNEDSSGDEDFEKPADSKQFKRELHSDDKNGKDLSEDDVDEVEVPTNATTVSNKSKLDGGKGGSMSTDEDMPNGNKPRKKYMEGPGDSTVKDGNEGSSKNGASPISDSSKNKVESDALPYPDPEFYDFDKDRDKKCFAVNQVWALYDDLDGMPRFYARIRSVSSSGFKLRFTWLEYVPASQAEKDWADEQLPVGCGNFIHGKTDSTEVVHSFSHVVPVNEDSKGNSYGIYPRKGQVWALYKGWDIKWSDNSDRHSQYEYEFAEILSDFTFDAGVNATPLAKVRGFVSLFCQGGRDGACILHIPPNELLRFSHMVPSYRMTGKERQGVPEGFYELDPASLPTNFQETFDSVTLDEVGVKDEHRRHANGKQCLNSRTMEKKSTNDFSSKNKEEATEKAGIEKSPEGDDTSAEGLNRTYERKHQRTSKAMEAEKNFSTRHPGVNEEESHFGTHSNYANNAMENGKSYMSESSRFMVSEYPDSEFYDFQLERSRGRYQAGQIWALYCEEDGFPKNFAFVRKVNSEDFKVHITWLEALAASEEELKWSNNDLPFACGRFRLCSGRGATETYDTTGTFSHLVMAEPVEKRQYDIYPQVSEVWAVYRNWNVEWKKSDVKKCSEKGEYELVEVLSARSFGLTVVILEKVDGFQAVFKPRKDKGVPSTMEIPRHEQLRFSHRIPSFRLTEERGGKLRGYWELDPASVPDVFQCANTD